MRRKVEFIKVPAIKDAEYVVYTNYLDEELSQDKIFIGSIIKIGRLNHYYFRPKRDTVFGDYALSQIGKFLKKLNTDGSE